MQVIRAVAVIAMTAAVASAQPASPPPAAPPAPSDPAETPTADDYRDVFADHRASAPEATARPTVPPDESLTGSGRLGVYHDSDGTTIERSFATMSRGWGEWSVTASAAVDAITSASVDVRSSPALSKLDIVTVEEGSTTDSGVQLTDTRYVAAGGARWHDIDGHAVTMTGTVSTESDYTSAGVGVLGSLDLDERDLTLFGGTTVTDNWVGSVVDPTVARKLLELGWTAGAARVLSASDMVRVRYDGKFSDGFQGSPYRTVRFGDWTTSTATSGQYVFANTIGSADGLPEKLPSLRLESAVTGEWVHALAQGIALHTAVRVSHDTWDVSSVAPSEELRFAFDGWRMQLGYRFYLQGRASFFEDKYTMDPEMYEHYTSDKQLGREVGHTAMFDVAVTVVEAETPRDSRMVLFLHADGFHFAYPDYELLPSRYGAFGELGLSWEH